MKKPFLLYLRSRLNITVSIVAAAAFLLFLLFFGPWGKIAAPAVLFVYLIATALLFFSRKGASEVVAESEEDRLNAISAKIDGYLRIRDRIAVLRIGDEGVRKAVEHFLLVSGDYIQKCRELSSYSPAANERIERALEICQVFLGEADESSTERRYGTAARGADETPEDFAARSIEAMGECATVIKERAVRDLEGSSGAERLAIMKELEDGK
ncbi:MAG: hypothetical protein IMZ69_05035 [Spirochaetes bacterium]|nr:hypothetical protein [Spirochaetota bacterium]